MKLKAFALVGFVLVALTALAGFSDCPHANAMTLEKGIVAVIDADTQSGNEHQCHHTPSSTDHTLVAWVRSAPIEVVTTPPPTKYQTLPAVSLFVLESHTFAGRERQRPPCLADGAYSGFAEIFARNSRLLI